MLQNPVHHARMKHIAVKYDMLRQLLENNVISGGRTSTDVNPADVGTKPFGRRHFISKCRLFFKGLNVLDYLPIDRPLTKETVGEYV